MAPRASYYTESCLLDPPSDPTAAERNGEYRGPCEVRVIPPGVSGYDLAAAARVKPAPGQVWSSGPRRIRITQATLIWISFKQLTHRKAVRRMKRPQFLRTYQPQIEHGADLD